MKKKIIISLGLITVCLACGLFILGRLMRPRLSALLGERVQESLGERFESRVQFSDFRLSLFPRPSATVTEVVLLHHGRTDVPPLIQATELSLAMHWRGFTGPRVRISQVTVKGLRITLPPRAPGSRPRENAKVADSQSKYPIFIEKLRADDSQIILLRAQPEKRPLIYLMHRLEVKNLGFDRPAEFESTLTNAVPRGEIYAKGSFGPWQSDAPRDTPVEATYRFEHADLGTIKGLQGILSSTGTFAGPLDYLDVKGSTVTPDFTLRRVANPIDLRTEFSATVDGTNGNTYLHSVRAHFLHSTLSTQGEVIDRDSSVRGRTILLDVESSEARAEDLIWLAVKTDRPVVRGPVKLQAKIRIPEEDKDLSDRLEVSSHFVLSDGQFTNPTIQEKVDLLSRKGQGEPKNPEIAHVPSELVATMHCQNAKIQFSSLEFLVPGAHLNLQGSYTLGDGALAFDGSLFLDAKLSRTTTGAKSFFLKAADPFFRGKNGGARIPVKVEGTKDHPTFGLGHVKAAKEPSTGGHDTATLH